MGDKLAFDYTFYISLITVGFKEAFHGGDDHHCHLALAGSTAGLFRQVSFFW